MSPKTSEKTNSAGNQAHARLIAVEGLDGSGKQTQAHLLCDELRKRGLRVEMLSFPTYGEPSAAPVEEYLHGVYGTDPDSVNAYGASILFAADRFASYKKTWQGLYESCDVLICDRYVGSNAIHQCSKLPEGEWEGFVAWLSDLEFARCGIPEPDRTVYLRVGVRESQELMSGRYGGDAGKRDIHEADIDYLLRSQRAAEWCAQRLGWSVVECECGGGMRSVEDIHREVLARVGA